MIKFLKGHPILALMIWAALAVEFVVALARGQLDVAFLALVTFVLTLMPLIFARRMDLRIPGSFVAAIVLFIFAAIFLGEASGFYDRYWWWDILLHSLSAAGLGLAGFLVMFMLFEGDRYAAPPWAVAFFAFCFAISIGAVWEIFEFAMDQNFGLNMQKSGLDDTMWDLIITAIGAVIGAMAGFVYLKGSRLGGLLNPLGEFIRTNARFFRKAGR